MSPPQQDDNILYLFFISSQSATEPPVLRSKYQSMLEVDLFSRRAPSHKSDAQLAQPATAIPADRAGMNPVLIQEIGALANLGAR